MTPTESIGVGILVAIVVWLVKSGIGFVLRRGAIRDALIFDIRSRIVTITGDVDFLDELVDLKIKVGTTIPYSARYELPKYRLFEALLPDIVSHLPIYFSHILEMYSAIKGANELTHGILLPAGQSGLLPKTGSFQGMRRCCPYGAAHLLETEATEIVSS